MQATSSEKISIYVGIRYGYMTVCFCHLEYLSVKGLNFWISHWGSVQIASVGNVYNYNVSVIVFLYKVYHISYSLNCLRSHWNDIVRPPPQLITITYDFSRPLKSFSILPTSSSVFAPGLIQLLTSNLGWKLINSCNSFFEVTIT